MRSVEIEIKVDGREFYGCLVQEGNAERVARAMRDACRAELQVLINEDRKNRGLEPLNAGAVSSGKTDVVQIIDPKDVVG